MFYVLTTVSLLSPPPGGRDSLGFLQITQGFSNEKLNPQGENVLCKASSLQSPILTNSACTDPLTGVCCSLCISKSIKHSEEAAHWRVVACIYHLSLSVIKAKSVVARLYQQSRILKLCPKMNLCLCVHRLFHTSQKGKSSHYREISGFREIFSICLGQDFPLIRNLV